MGNVPSQPDSNVEDGYDKTFVILDQHERKEESPPIVETPQEIPVIETLQESPLVEEIPVMETSRESPPIERSQEYIYRDKVMQMYQHYFDMFNGGLKAPTGNKSYEEYVQWRYWKGEYERLCGKV